MNPLQPIRFTWSRVRGYEVSSKGDRRFSAFVAKLKDGQSIEWHYQVKVKGYNTIFEGKGKPPKNRDINLLDAYVALWVEWANANPKLIKELREKALENGGVLCDQFANTPVNQAHALSLILNKLEELKQS